MYSALEDIGSQGKGFAAGLGAAWYISRGRSPRKSDWRGRRGRCHGERPAPGPGCRLTASHPVRQRNRSPAPQCTAIFFIGRENIFTNFPRRKAEAPCRPIPTTTSSRRPAGVPRCKRSTSGGSVLQHGHSSMTHWAAPLGSQCGKVPLPCTASRLPWPRMLAGPPRSTPAEFLRQRLPEAWLRLRSSGIRPLRRKPRPASRRSSPTSPEARSP